MYQLSFSDEAENQLKKLDKLTKERIIAALERIRLRPESYVQRMVGSPFYKLRVGDYRVILKINKNELITLVIKLGHRKNIYEKL